MFMKTPKYFKHKQTHTDIANTNILQITQTQVHCFLVDDSPSSTVTAAPFKKGEDWKFPEVTLLPPAPLPTEVASCLLLPLVDIGEECLPLSPPPLCCLSLLPMEGEVSPPLPTQALPHLHPSAILSPSAL